MTAVDHHALALARLTEAERLARAAFRAVDDLDAPPMAGRREIAAARAALSRAEAHLDNDQRDLPAVLGLHDLDVEDALAHRTERTTT